MDTQEIYIADTSVEGGARYLTLGEGFARSLIYVASTLKNHMSGISILEMGEFQSGINAINSNPNQALIESGLFTKALSSISTKQGTRDLQSSVIGDALNDASAIYNLITIHGYMVGKLPPPYTIFNLKNEEVKLTDFEAVSTIPRSITYHSTVMLLNNLSVLKKRDHISSEGTGIINYTISDGVFSTTVDISKTRKFRQSSVHTLLSILTEVDLKGVYVLANERDQRKGTVMRALLMKLDTINSKRFKIPSFGSNHSDLIDSMTITSLLDGNEYELKVSFSKTKGGYKMENAVIRRLTKEDSFKK
ncbi:MAG: hypothetical protein WCO33_01480 [bacterium]